MKTEITPEEYKNIYEVCDWNSKAVSIVLKRLGYSDELIVKGGLDLEGMAIQSLTNIKVVRGKLNLARTPIQDLGNLEEVEGYLDLDKTPIEDLGNLKEVQHWFGLMDTPISKNYSRVEIKQMIKVGGHIYL